MKSLLLTCIALLILGVTVSPAHAECPAAYYNHPDRYRTDYSEAIFVGQVVEIEVIDTQEQHGEEVKLYLLTLYVHESLKGSAAHGGELFPSTSSAPNLRAAYCWNTPIKICHRSLVRGAPMSFLSRILGTAPCSL